MNLDEMRESIITKVYHITKGQNVALHRHRNHDEVFYCFKGEGFGVYETSEEALSVSKVFIVTAGTMHALRTDSDLFVASFLIPADKEKPANI